MSDCVSEDSFLLIFKHLPVKTLLRFRCVCKWWKGLIDSHSFILDHLSVQKPRFIADYEVPNQFLIIDPLNPPFVDTLTGIIRDEPELNLRLLGTLHGVVCLSVNETEYLLWNPWIRKFSIIPLPEAIDLELDDGEEVAYTVSSFFAEFAFSGFWIDPSTKEFKIITVKMLGTDESCDDSLHGIIYSSLIKDWMMIRGSDLNFYNCKPMTSTPPVMIGGVAYWRAYNDWTDPDIEEHPEDGEDPERPEVGILSFNFVHEDFEYIRVPNKNYSSNCKAPFRSCIGIQSFLVDVIYTLGKKMNGLKCSASYSPLLRYSMFFGCWKK